MKVKINIGLPVAWRSCYHSFMEDWTPENPAILEFDINECTPCEFCEVFAMEPSVAFGLYEYRTEVSHIFKLEQILKLKGISEEQLKQWSEPQVEINFDLNLQRSLGLQAEAGEPLSSLLEGFGRQIRGSIRMMTRFGEILIQANANGSPEEFPSVEISETIRAFQDDITQMKSPPSELHVIGFDANDLVFLPAGAFYIAAMSPKGGVTVEGLNLYRALAKEVRRRHPPRICVNNYAPVGENDVVFYCSSCNLRIVVDKSGAGYNFPCPRCKKSVTVPGEPVPESA